MRILGIDIKQNGIRIPYTQIRIPIYMAVTSLIALFGTPVTGAPMECRRPTGDYEGSCTPNTVKTYTSSDPNVPDACVFSTNCNTMFSGLPPVPNNIYYAQHDLIEQVSNNNGTLTYRRSEDPITQDSAMSSSSDKKAIEPCTQVPLIGSFRKTCFELSKGAYQTSDPNLNTVSLCKAELSCEQLDGHYENGLTVWYDRTRGGKVKQEIVENCNGQLKVGPKDDQCQGENYSTISELSKKHAQKTVRV